MQTVITYQLLIQSLEAAATAEIFDISLGMTDDIAALKELELLSADSTPTKLGWKILSVLWSDESFYDKSTVGDPEAMAETAQLMSTGHMRIRKGGIVKS